MHKFTPGPWVPQKGAGWMVTRPDAQARREAALAVGMKPDASIVESPGWPTNDEEARHNAYLMAAAPDFYEATDSVDVFAARDLNDDRHDDHVVPVLMTLGTIRKFREALAKANSASHVQDRPSHDKQG